MFLMSEQKKEQIDVAKLITVLDYLWIFALLGLFIEKENEDVRFHTNQGLILLLCAFVSGIVLTALGALPAVGVIFRIVGLLASLACLAYTVLGIYNAVTGQRKPLPYIGTLFTFIK